METKLFDGEKKELSSIRKFVKDFLVKIKVEEDLQYQLLLVVGEATMNIVQHAYKGGNKLKKIKDDLDDANKFKELSESKIREYENILENAKKEVTKILIESKKNLDKDIQSKKVLVEKEIESEIIKAQKEILDLKKNSISSIQNIAENIASKIIENLSGDKLNESSIKATVEDISKNKIGKYL